MSYAARSQATVNDAEYTKLVQLKARAEEVTTDWITRATALYAATVDSADKAELLALRNQFGQSLKTILGL
jgi:hypothetical protein